VLSKCVEVLVSTSEKTRLRPPLGRIADRFILDSIWRDKSCGLPCKTRLTRGTIRQQVREGLNLTASAGVAPNKFLAKIASDWRKSCSVGKSVAYMS
jgi:hypothetical protein